MSATNGWRHSFGHGYNRYARRLPGGELAIVETTGRRPSLIVGTRHWEFNTVADAMEASFRLASEQ